MPKSDDETKDSTVKIDRRAVIGGALVVGGLSALAQGASMEPAQQEAFVAEREWARALARHVSSQLPEAARQIPDLRLSPEQLEQLQKAFENTLITNMGCNRSR